LSDRGFHEQKVATQVPIPDAMRKDFDIMVSRTNLQNAPTLEFYSNLHGVGGMFVGDQWAILIGVQDQQEIAAAVFRRWPAELQRIYLRVNKGRIPSQTQLFNWTVEAAIRRCMGHELGHALRATGRYQSPYADEEAAADYLAGKLDALRNMSPDLGRMFFFTIGCTGPSCTHPEPTTRAEAYQRGYDEQRLAA
jgi:hypothetical protein